MPSKSGAIFTEKEFGNKVRNDRHSLENKIIPLVYLSPNNVSIHLNKWQWRIASTWICMHVRAGVCACVCVYLSLYVRAYVCVCVCARAQLLYKF